MELILTTGQSGAGRSCVIKTLEDCGYYALDHLPLATLPVALEALEKRGISKVAAGVDPWEPIGNFPVHYPYKLLVLTASNHILLERYANTNRRHPLSNTQVSLLEAIEEEKKFVGELPRNAIRIDTSFLSPETLMSLIKNQMELSHEALRVVIQSFGYKYQMPMDLDGLYDVRCLPNPYYNTELRPYTGLDPCIEHFFSKAPTVESMIEEVCSFVNKWYPQYQKDHRSVLQIGIGCTGGQHRSVFVAHQVAKRLQEQGISAHAAHREQSRWPRQGSAAPSP